MKKRILAILLAASCAVGLAACSGGSTGSESSTPAAPSSSAASSAPATDGAASSGDEAPAAQAGAVQLPLTEKTETLSIFSQLDPKAAMSVTTYADLECFKKIEENTNVKIEWQHPSGTALAEAFNLLVASGEYPDIIYYGWTSAPGGPEKYIKDKVIIDHTELVNQVAPNYKAILDSNKEYYKSAVTDEGHMWGFSMLFGDFEDPQGYPKSWLGLQVRQDWLDRLGLQQPNSIEEWTAVLTAFKEQDADGDGDPNNEIPFSGKKEYYDANLGLGAFMTAYGLIWDFYYAPDGTVKYGPAQPEAKDFFATMAEWYKNGLIDKDFGGQDATALDAKIKSGVVGAWCTGAPRWGHYVNANPDRTTFNPVGVKWPKDPSGKMHTTIGDPKYPGGGAGAAITTTSKKQELAAKWLDYLYSEEGGRIMNWGVEGESYTMVDGKPQWTDEIIKNPEMNVEQAVSKYTFVPLSGWAVLQSGYAKRGTLSIPGQLDMYDLWADALPDLVLPPYAATTEESTKLATIMNNVNTRVREIGLGIIIGKNPIDDFDKLVTELNGMGLEEATQIVQAAVTRYENR